MSDRNKAVELLDDLRERGFDDTDILEYIVYNHLSGSNAVECLEGYYEEVDIDLEEEEEEEEEEFEFTCENCYEEFNESDDKSHELCQSCYEDWLNEEEE